MMIFNCKCSTIFSSSDKTRAAVIAVEMHIAHAIMLFSSLEAVKAGKEKAIQIRRGEKGDFFSTTILCAYCILPITVARKGYLSGFSSCSTLHSSGSSFLRSSNIDNCYCAMSTTIRR